MVNNYMRYECGVKIAFLLTFLNMWANRKNRNFDKYILMHTVTHKNTLFSFLQIDKWDTAACPPSDSLWHRRQLLFSWSRDLNWPLSLDTITRQTRCIISILCMSDVFLRIFNRQWSWITQFMGVGRKKTTRHRNMLCLSRKET